MKVIAKHVIETENGIGIFEELHDGRYLYLHHKLRPFIISKTEFERVVRNKKLSKVSSLT